MKIVNKNLEMLVIRSLCAGKDRIKGTILASMDDSYFHYPHAKEAFEYIKKYAHENSKMMSWVELTNDGAVSEPTRKILRAYKEEPILTADRLKSVSKILLNYRRKRMLFHMAKYVSETLHEEKVNIDEVMEEVGEIFSEARTSMSVADAFIHYGRGSNVRKTLKKVLTGEAIRYIPTGFRAYDEQSVGIPQGSFMIIAGPTSGGKSTVASQLAKNQAMWGAKVAYVPLEMTGEEMVQRDVSNIGQESMLNLLDPKNRIKKKRRKELYNSVKVFDRKLHKKGTTLSYFNPPQDMTMEEVLFLLKPLGYDVIIIDYVGLLKGVDGEDQWKALSKATRFGKVFANQNKINVVCCAQLSAEGIIRYSKGMQEHANVMWQWLYGQEQRETGIIEIEQPKSRNQKGFTFRVMGDFDKMTVRDLTEDEQKMFDEGDYDDDADAEGGGKKKKKGKGKKGRFKKRKSSEKQSKNRDDDDDADTDDDIEDDDIPLDDVD